MIRSVQALLPALLLLVFAVPFFAQDNSNNNTTGTIRGTVIDTKTSHPLAGARVRLVGRGSGGAKSATTNADGAFVFSGIAPGRYAVNASQEGYSSGSRGSNYSGRSGSAIAVGAGQSIDDVVIRLAPAGMIAGRVTNERDNPMPKVFVEAVRRSYRDGQLSLTGARSAFTDDHGEFRISGLAPGTYCLKVTKPRNWENGRVPSLVYVPVFYPSVVDPAQAQTVELHPGEELSGIQFTLTPVNAVHVKGKIATSNGKPVEAANVTLSQFGSNGYVREDQSTGSGKFDIAGVPAGSYTLDAQWSADIDSARLLTGRATLSVGDTDVVAPDIVLYPGATVSGRVVVEGDRKVLMPRSASLIPLGGAGGYASTSVQADGSFVFQDVPQGNYRIRLTPLPGGYYVNPDTDAGKRLATVAVNHGQATVEVRLTHGAGQIQGVIYQDSDKRVPAASATVVLLPDSEQPTAGDNYRVVTSDRSGRFMIQSVAPGDYSLVALEDVERDGLTDPDQLREFKNIGQSVRVETGGSLDLQVPLAVPAGSSIQ